MGFTISAAHRLLMELARERATPRRLRVTLDVASQDLLARSREFVVGCGKASCTCEKCAEATTILDLVAAHLQRACEAQEKADE